MSVANTKKRNVMTNPNAQPVLVDADITLRPPKPAGTSDGGSWVSRADAPGHLMAKVEVRLTDYPRTQATTDALAQATAHVNAHVAAAVRAVESTDDGREVARLRSMLADAKKDQVLANSRVHDAELKRSEAIRFGVIDPRKAADAVRKARGEQAEVGERVAAISDLLLAAEDRVRRAAAEAELTALNQQRERLAAEVKTREQELANAVLDHAAGLHVAREALYDVTRRADSARRRQVAAVVTPEPAETNHQGADEPVHVPTPRPRRLDPDLTPSVETPGGLVAVDDDLAATLRANSRAVAV